MDIVDGDRRLTTRHLAMGVIWTSSFASRTKNQKVEYIKKIELWVEQAWDFSDLSQAELNPSYKYIDKLELSQAIIFSLNH